MIYQIVKYNWISLGSEIAYAASLFLSFNILQVFYSEHRVSDLKESLLWRLIISQLKLQVWWPKSRVKSSSRSCPPQKKKLHFYTLKNK